MTNLSPDVRAEAPFGWTDEELRDLISDAISDSMEMDWTSGDGARAVFTALQKEGLLRTDAPPVPSAQPKPERGELAGDLRNLIQQLIIDVLSDGQRGDAISGLARREPTVDAILAALATQEQGEPVAWRAKLGGAEHWNLCKYDPTGEVGWHSITPLYARPRQPAPAASDEALRVAGLVEDLEGLESDLVHRGDEVGAATCRRVAKALAQIEAGKTSPVQESRGEARTYDGSQMVAAAKALLPWLKNYPPSTRQERSVEAANAALIAALQDTPQASEAISSADLIANTDYAKGAIDDRGGGRGA